MSILLKWSKQCIKFQSSQVLKSIDIFGYPVQLFTDQENTFRSSFSGLVSSVLVAIMFNIFYNSAIQYLTKQQVTSSTAQSFDPNPAEIVMDASNFMFAVSLAQSDYVFNVRPYFNVTLQQKIYTTNDNGTKVKNFTYLTMEPCTLEKFQNIFGQYGLNFSTQFSKLNLSQWLCPLDDYQIRIGGSFSNSLFEYSKIEISQCHNSTSKGKLWSPVCAPNDTVAAQTDFGFSIYTINYIVNSQIPDTFIQPYLSDQLYFNFFPQKIYKLVDIYYREQDIVTDNSIFYGSDNQNNQIFYNDYKDYNERVDVTQPNAYSAFYFRRSYFTESTQRQFQKFGDLVSYLGGFTGILLPLFGAFLQVYNKYAFIMYIANKIYYFNLKINGSNALSPTQNQDTQKNLSEKSICNLTFFPASLTKLDDDLDEKKQKINISTIFTKKESQNQNKNPQVHPYNSQGNDHDKSIQQIDNSIINEQSYLVVQPIAIEISKQENSKTHMFDNNVLQTNFGRAKKLKKEILPSLPFSQNHNTEAPMFEISSNGQNKITKSKLPIILEIPINKIDSYNKISFKAVEDIPLKNADEEKTVPSQQVTQRKGAFKLFRKIKVKLFAVTAMIRLNRKKAFIFQSSFNKLFREFKHLKYSFQWIVNSLTNGKCFDNRLSKITNKTIEKIYTDLDILSFIKKDQELKKLKSIILQERQLLLFNVQPRKIIQLDDEEEINLQDLKRASKKSNASNKDEPEQEYKKIQEAYQWCLVECDKKEDQNQLRYQQSNMISINSKLMEALGDELKSNLALIR